MYKRVIGEIDKCVNLIVLFIDHTLIAWDNGRERVGDTVLFLS